MKGLKGGKVRTGQLITQFDEMCNVKQNNCVIKHDEIRNFRN